MTGDMPLHVRVRLPLDRFDLDVDFQTTHRVTGVFGVSGSGKTTLLETVAGLRREARGRISLGSDVWLDSEQRLRLPPERRDIGYVPQDSLLFPHLDVLGNLHAGRRRAVRGGNHVENTLETVVRVLDLGPLLRRPVTTLSGGERQRVALARSTVMGPRVLLADEPTGNLDTASGRQILELLDRLNDEGITLVVVTHDPSVARRADRVIVLVDGHVARRLPGSEIAGVVDLFAPPEET